MNFEFSPPEEALRAEVQAFITTHLNADVLREIKEERDSGRRGPLATAFFERVHAAGYLAVSWPEEYGGRGLGAMAQFIVEEEFYRATDLRIGAAGSGAPAILECGTEEQKRHYLPAVVRREITFAQGYTEPGCGSDLAGIQCRALRCSGADGETYVVNGQKIYVTDAHTATHIFLMVRTDPASKRHAGLSILLVPMNTPGITVRALWTIQNEPQAPLGTTYGERRVNEVFFQDVVVPASCRLGAEGDGWSVSSRGLNLDRVGAFRYVISIMRDEDIVNWLNRDELGATRRDDPVLRDRVAEMWTEAQVCRLMTMRSLSIVQRGDAFSYEGSAEKVWAPEHGVRSSEAYGQLIGPHAQLLSSSPDAVAGGLFAHNLLGAFQSTVNHGSVHVMRDQIARRGLNLPRASKAT
jgi:3-oxocholest-4-en-26-oyl-CoA dehydrogenase alpha subunit